MGRRQKLPRARRPGALRQSGKHMEETPPHTLPLTLLKTRSLSLLHPHGPETFLHRSHGRLHQATLALPAHVRGFPRRARRASRPARARHQGLARHYRRQQEDVRALSGLRRRLANRVQHLFSAEVRQAAMIPPSTIDNSPEFANSASRSLLTSRKQMRPTGKPLPRHTPASQRICRVSTPSAMRATSPEDIKSSWSRSASNTTSRRRA